MTNKQLVLDTVNGRFYDKAFHAREVMEAAASVKPVHISIVRAVLGEAVKEGALITKGEGGHRRYVATDVFATVTEKLLAGKQEALVSKEQVKELLAANDDNKAAVMRLLDIGREKLNRLLAK